MPKPVDVHDLKHIGELSPLLEEYHKNRLFNTNSSSSFIESASSVHYKDFKKKIISKELGNPADINIKTPVSPVGSSNKPVSPVGSSNKPVSPVGSSNKPVSPVGSSKICVSVNECCNKPHSTTPGEIKTPLKQESAEARKVRLAQQKLRQEEWHHKRKLKEEKLQDNKQDLTTDEWTAVNDLVSDGKFIYGGGTSDYKLLTDNVVCTLCVNNSLILFLFSFRGP